MQFAAIELVSTMKGKAAQYIKLVPLSNDLFEKILPSNLRSIFLQRPSDLQISSVLSKEFFKL